jgi:hypothetical protein
VYAKRNLIAQEDTPDLESIDQIGKTNIFKCARKFSCKSREDVPENSWTAKQRVTDYLKKIDLL